jgi:hypothetical protein
VQAEVSGFFFEYDFSIRLAISILDSCFTNILSLVPIHLHPFFLAAATGGGVHDIRKILNPRMRCRCNSIKQCDLVL